MELIEQEEFVTAYTKVLVSAWTDQEYAGRLESDPAQALAEHGLTVPEGAEVVVTRVIPEESAGGGVEVAVGKWEAGKISGTYVLSVPATPQVDLSELSEDDLLSISGGLSISHCCCTPCCCCA
ncbi:MAG: hypothetical protein ACR2M5_15845 [Nakamurella sp.]